MIRTLAMTLFLILLLPVSLTAEHQDVRASLEQAIEAWESGESQEALRHIRHARQAIISHEVDIPEGVLGNLAELDRALAAFRLYVYGRRPDLDATHDAVLRVIGDLRLAYGEQHRSIMHRTRRADFDIDGRIRRLGDLEIGYVPFTDRIREIGEIEIEYVPFSEHPREIGPIEYWWVFGELREVADQDVDQSR